MRMNVGFAITNSVNVGKTEFVLGVNTNAPNNFVTWECKNGKDYFFGHYFTDLLSAQKDLCIRGLEEVKHIEHIRKSIEER